MFDSIFADGELREFIEGNLKDPWEDTPFKGYVFKSPKDKGEFGERFVSKWMNRAGHKVERAKTSTAGHDRVIDGILTEIKFSLATRDRKGGTYKDKFIMNHVSVCKDWERLIFCGINEQEDDLRIVWFSKEDFANYMKSEDCIFKPQQAGKGGGNDDYICTNIPKLIELDFVKDIKEW